MKRGRVLKMYVWRKGGLYGESKRVNQRATLNAYLFWLVIDKLTKGVNDVTFQRTMSVGVVVLVENNTNELEYKRVRWRKVFEKNKQKIIRAKTEFVEFRFKAEVGGNVNGHNVSF